LHVTCLANPGESYPILDIKTSRFWKIDCANINEIILRKHASVEAFIQKTFDLEFCKAMYNGKCLKIFNLESIRTKTSKYSFTSKCENECQHRIGFRENPDKAAYKCARNKATLTLRMPKYLERGFTLIVNEKRATCDSDDMECVHIKKQKL
jgi:hypothetical protein